MSKRGMFATMSSHRNSVVIVMKTISNCFRLAALLFLHSLHGSSRVNMKILNAIQDQGTVEHCMHVKCLLLGHAFHNYYDCNDKYSIKMRDHSHEANKWRAPVIS